MRQAIAVSLTLLLALTCLLPTAAGAAGRGQACGGFFPVMCDAGLFCEFPAGQCGRFDMQGICQVRPRFCNRIYRPVCACNGRTFGNDCERRAAGASLAHPGRC